MPAVNLLKTFYPRKSSDSIKGQLSDSFRLREQISEIYGMGEMSIEAINGIIGKNKEDLMNNYSSLSSNDRRDLESQINLLEIKKVNLERKEAIDSSDIEDGLEKTITTLKTLYTSNPYEYVTKVRDIYDVILKGSSEVKGYEDLNFEGLEYRISLFKDEYGLDVGKLESLRDKYEIERGKYSKISEGLETGNQAILNNYSLVYNLSQGRIRDIDFKPYGETKGVWTDANFSLDNGNPKLSSDKGISIRLEDTQEGKLPKDKMIPLAFSPFYWKKEEGKPAYYSFAGDIDAFNYGDVEFGGIETRNTGDIVKSSVGKQYYVDKNRDLRPILDKDTFNILSKGGRKSVYSLAPSEEERLSYLVKEPVNYKMEEAQREALTNQYKVESLANPWRKVTPVQVPAGGFRLPEYTAAMKKVQTPSGKESIAARTGEIFKGAFERFAR